MLKKLHHDALDGRVLFVPCHRVIPLDTDKIADNFNGFFTGQYDYLNLKDYYGSNTTVKDNWLGVNLGTGIEHNFGIVGLFIDYRMRVGRAEKAINIMDVCYTAGLKVRFPYGKLAKTLAHPDDRFHWF